MSDESALLPAAELEDLVARLMRPERPRLEEARATVEGVTDPREAWELLAARGLIPDDAVDDPHRRFASVGRFVATIVKRRRPDSHVFECTAEVRPATPDEAAWPAVRLPSVELDGARMVFAYSDYEYTGANFAPGARAMIEAPVAVAHPTSVQAAVALASGFAGAVTAESLARELAVRLDQADTARALVWRVEALAALAPRVYHRPGEHLAGVATAGRAAQAAERFRAVVARERGKALAPFAEALAKDALRAAAWARRRVARASPFAVLVEIWQRGYAAGGLDESSVELFAPAV